MTFFIGMFFTLMRWPHFGGILWGKTVDYLTSEYRTLLAAICITVWQNALNLHELMNIDYSIFKTNLRTLTPQWKIFLDSECPASPKSQLGKPKVVLYKFKKLRRYYLVFIVRWHSVTFTENIHYRKVKYDRNIWHHLRFRSKICSAVIIKLLKFSHVFPIPSRK